MNKEEKLIRSYFEPIEDINQTQSIEVLPLTLVDMLLEYGKILGVEPVKVQSVCYSYTCGNNTKGVCNHGDYSCSARQTE